MKNLLISLLASFPLLLAACSPSGPEEPPTPTIDSSQYAPGNTTVVYECNERLFARSQVFKKIEAYLPTLRQMQVDMLWLMPVHPRGQVNSVGSPYCVKNYRQCDPAFGSLDDFRALVDAAHACGMRVMLDWVANHTALDHPWYLTHPEWYTEPEGDEKGWKDVAPLDYEQAVVCDTMLAEMLFWVREYDVDGFRCDYAHGAPEAFWQHAIETLKAAKPSLIMLAETSKTSYYKAGFDWLYSWNYLSAIQKLFKNGKEVPSLMRTSRNEYSSTPDGKERLRYVTTHDASSENAPSEFYKTAQAELAAACLTYFLGGVPMIYSSQEIGYLSKINFFDYNVLKFDSANAVTKQWIELMRAYENTSLQRGGKLEDFSTDEVALFTRTNNDLMMLVAVNCSKEAKEVVVPDWFSGQDVTNAITRQGEHLDERVRLEAYGYAVYTR